VHPQLSEYFLGAAAKVLSAVEVQPEVSRQHEFNGVRALVDLLGEPVGSHVFPTRFIRIDDDLATLEATASLTWYDARRQAREERQVMRWEYRLYYPDNSVMDEAIPGDLLILARRPDGSLVVVISPTGSSVSSQLRAVFGLEDRGELFTVTPEPRDVDLSYTSAALLEALGIEIRWVEEDRLEGLLSAFGGIFPATSVFSDYARRQVPEVDPLVDPDGALVEWMTMEEVLFRTLEKHLVTADLQHVDGDVEGILAIAQRVFQRRRARAGQALENHVQHILLESGIPHTRGGVTEGTKRPDFLFPGVDSYHDPGYPPSGLLMLGVKTTCRDRWRQVLTEADRIPEKHLLTLEAPISPAQLDEMAAANLTLVIPEGLHGSFVAADRTRLLSVRDMLTLASDAAGHRSA
jgi:hypothetical protein